MKKSHISFGRYGFCVRKIRFFRIDKTLVALPMPILLQPFSCSGLLLGQEFSYGQVHKFPLEMASPPLYILAVCFENCLRQRRFLRRSQQNGCAAASIFAIPKRFNRNFSQNHKDKYPPNKNRFIQYLGKIPNFLDNFNLQGE